MSPLQVHSLQDLDSVLVDGGSLQDLLFVVHRQRYAGVDVQGNHRGHGVGKAVISYAQSQSQNQAGSCGPGNHPAGNCKTFFLCHINHGSFPFFTAGEDGFQFIGSGMLNSLSQPAVQFLFLHRSSSPFSEVFSFFRALWYLDSTVGRGISNREAISLCRIPATA